MSKKHLYATILLVIIFVMANKIFAQEENDVVVDSIDFKEDLLDSNHVYQQKFDSLSKDGDWVEIKKSDFVKEVEGGSAEAVDYQSSSTIEVIYVWRPRNIDYGWNPYYNGRWEFTYYGWCWVSDYSWGSACYNYGRWYWSAFYGWVWLPGTMWACNWVTWRHCGNYWGWYPTCPRIRWRNHRGAWCRNYTFKSQTKHWVLVNEPGFTKKVTKESIVDPTKNGELMKNTSRVSDVNLTTTNGARIKYTGPKVTSIEKQTGSKIDPKDIRINPTKGITQVVEPRVTRNPRETKGSTTRDGKYNNPRNENPTKGDTPTRGNDGPRYNPPTKGNDGPRNSPPTKGNDGPRNNPPTKSNPPPKSDPPTKRSDPPSGDKNGKK